MLDKIMLSITGESVTITNSLLIVGTSIILGILISVVYMKTNQKSNLSSGFSTTLIMLPVIISIIILLVGNNVARAFSLAGAFSIIRFRSAPGDPKDIAYIFFTLAIGLTCGMGYIAYGFLFTLIISAVMIGLHITKFTEPKDKTMQLKITIPEDLNYEGIFEDILNNYTNYYNIQRVKTRDFGSLFELTYIINLKHNINQNSFIDELRCRNGNLNITLTL
ncbi:DUF4956 domain-containing protein, partial [Terrisporobacter muris]